MASATGGFRFFTKKNVSYDDFSSLPGVFENQFQRGFQIDNCFFPKSELKK